MEIKLEKLQDVTKMLREFKESDLSITKFLSQNGYPASYNLYITNSGLFKNTATKYDPNYICLTAAISPIHAKRAIEKVNDFYKNRGDERRSKFSNGAKQLSWTESNVEELKLLISHGKKNSEIAEIMDRSINSIQSKKRKLSVVNKIELPKQPVLKPVTKIKVDKPNNKYLTIKINKTKIAKYSIDILKYIAIFGVYEAIKYIFIN